MVVSTATNRNYFTV